MRAWESAVGDVGDLVKGLSEVSGQWSIPTTSNILRPLVQTALDSISAVRSYFMTTPFQLTALDVSVCHCEWGRCSNIADGGHRIIAKGGRF